MQIKHSLTRAPSFAALASALLFALMAASCAGDDPSLLIADEDCIPLDDIQPICGLSRPEDIVLLPDARHLLFSQMGDFFTGSPGSLAVMDSNEKVHRVLSPQEYVDYARWGSSDCPGPPGAALSPHGIHLMRRGDGRLQLLVVNHGGRESVEFYEVFLGQLNTLLLWRGCSVAPEKSFLNDVVGSADGGFYVTHMMEKDSRWALWKARLGLNTGHVLRWDPKEGYSVVEGSHGPFPNGVELSADGRHLFVNMYSKGVSKLRLKDGEVVARAKIDGPDNSSWSPGGELLVASHTASGRQVMACFENMERTCGYSFEIVAVNPVTMSARTVFSHSGPPMGAGTVAVEVGDEFFIGSFAGNRMITTPIPEESRP